ncbi:unnamed protein product [Triticum turgidum subsp. durum]|uniref:Mitochondrial import inner membrane translocase subunit n=1 Tax=Triticum turgidum subsp. durum TaxID=4567 RepID=A0A9R0QJ94_TRITD|nr:unnamed protein product [Triticum turgidum subsp. durum]
MNIVTGAMGSLLPKLGQLLMDEYNLHKRVKKDVEFLRKELESMHAALIKVGEVPPDQLDGQVKLWADEVRDLSYNMEDVVDKFLVRVDGDGIQLPHDNSSRFKIKEQLQEVAARRERNRLDGIAPNPSEAIAIDPRLHALYTEASELVGIYGKRDKDLMRLLSLESDGDASNKRLKKVSIVGFGGLGKTTLARAVYKKIKGDFDYGAFVSVGRNPDISRRFSGISSLISATLTQIWRYWMQISLLKSFMNS